MASTQRARLITFFGVGLVLVTLMILGAASAWTVWRADMEEVARSQDQNLVAPEPAPQGFVGSQRCAECHEEIFDRYQTHSMSRSMARIGESTPLEDYSKAQFSPDGIRHYRVEQTEEGEVHHEELRDAEGTIFDHAEPVNFVMGSGRRGRSYLLERDGILFQSPITWYANGNRWDLSPSYEAHVGLGFQRRIDDGCLYCHAGRVASESPGSGRYQEPTFHELAIGCERCHGPGEAHVAKQSLQLTSSGRDDSIVNPVHLDPERRDSVCYQCHLQGEAVIPRYGRTFHDFRPGDHLDDVWVTFVAGLGLDAAGQTKAVSQVEQMRASKCFIRSEGKLGCTSCHDPHFSPEPAQQEAFYRDRCLKCHGENQTSCSLDPARRAAAPANDSCIHCHMPALDASDVPHTSQTDHRVLRQPVKLGEAAEQVPVEDLKVFGDAEQRLSRREVERARGLVIANRQSSAKQATRVEELLLGGTSYAEDGSAALARAADDVAAFEVLGVVYQTLGQNELAVDCWQHALRLDPDNETALTYLAFHFHSKGEHELALQYLDRLLTVNPWDSNFHGRRAHLLGLQGDWQEAIASANQSLAINPLNNYVREWLVESQREHGDPQASEHHAEILRRIMQLQAQGPPPADAN
jgi:predicted CXXCH cytochrome family protein